MSINFTLNSTLDSNSSDPKFDIGDAPLFELTVWTIIYYYVIALIPYLTITFFLYFYWKIWKNKIQVSLQMKIHMFVWLMCMSSTTWNFTTFVLELRWRSEFWVF